MTYNDNTSYLEHIGYWVDGKASGQGICTWKDGTKYEGNYENDQQHGYGVYTWASGTQWHGKYVNGLKHDTNGYQLSTDGVKSYGTWQNGEFVKWND